MVGLFLVEQREKTSESGRCSSVTNEDDENDDIAECVIEEDDSAEN